MRWAALLTLSIACNSSPPAAPKPDAPPSVASTVAPAASSAPTPTPTPTPPPPMPLSVELSIDDFLKELPSLVRDDDTLASARTAAARTKDLKVDDATGLSFAFATPLDAKKVATLLGVKGDLYILSGDVHQRSWRLVVGGEKIADPHNDRIATDMPTLGSWQLDISIAERPSGPLPGIVSGASPAYPLAGRTALVTRVRFWK